MNCNSQKKNSLPFSSPLLSSALLSSPPSSLPFAGGRANMYSVTQVRQAFDILLQPHSLQENEDDFNAIVNDDDEISEDDIEFNYTKLDQEIDEKNNKINEQKHKFFFRKIPSVGDVVEILWEVEEMGTKSLVWYRAEVVTVQWNGGARPCNWKVRYEEDDTEEMRKFYLNEENWRVVELAAGSDEEDDEEEEDILVVNEEEEEEEEEEDDSDDDDSDDDGSDEFVYSVGDCVQLLYDDGSGRRLKKWEVKINKVTKRKVKVLYLKTKQIEIILKEDFDERVVSSRRNRGQLTPGRAAAAAVTKEATMGTTVKGGRRRQETSSSSLRKKRVFDDEEDEKEDDEIVKNKRRRVGTSKGRRVTPSSAIKTTLGVLTSEEDSSDDSDNEMVKSFTSSNRKKELMDDDSDSD